MTPDDRLADLLERWEAAAAAGLPPTPEDLCRDTPDDLAAFRELLRQLGRIGMIGGGPRDGRGQPIVRRRLGLVRIEAAGLPLDRKESDEAVTTAGEVGFLELVKEVQAKTGK